MININTELQSAFKKIPIHVTFYKQNYLASNYERNVEKPYAGTSKSHKGVHDPQIIYRQYILIREHIIFQIQPFFFFFNIDIQISHFYNIAENNQYSNKK